MAAQYNDIFDDGQPWSFRLTIYDEKWGKLNVSGWQFRLLVKNPDGTPLWDATNDDIIRPSTSSIYYSKDADTVAALSAGEYLYTLFVSNDEAVDDEMVKGIIVKP